VAYAYLGTSSQVSSTATDDGESVTLDSYSAIDAIGNRISTGLSSQAYLLVDLHGNVAAAVSPGADPEYLAGFRYDAFGQSVDAYAGGGAPSIPYRFQGRILQSAEGSTDLYDFGARSYDPSLGTFTSFDTVSGSAQNPLTLNRYLYALANPASFIDPDGHCAYNANTHRMEGSDCSAAESAYTDVSEEQQRAALRRLQLKRILTHYQVTEVEMIAEYVPTSPGRDMHWALEDNSWWWPLTPAGPRAPRSDVPSLGPMTSTEAAMFDDLFTPDPTNLLATISKLYHAYVIRGISEKAQASAKAEYSDVYKELGIDPETMHDDSHLDAFRHVYATAMMTSAMGAQWTAEWGIAHEQVPGNSARREAMDLYNDGLGIRIALAHPNATEAELARYVKEAIVDGQAVVIQGSDRDSHLAWSDVPVGSTGKDCDPGTGCDFKVTSSISPSGLIGGGP